MKTNTFENSNSDNTISRYFGIDHCKAKGSMGHLLGFMWEFSSRNEKINPNEDYDRVAYIEIKSTPDMSLNDILNRSFAVTNHIEKSWLKNPEVIMHTFEKVRSTSVGDIITDNISGERFIVAGCGFRKIIDLEANDVTIANTVEI